MAPIRVAITDWVSNSYFPVLAAEHFGCYAEHGIDAHVELAMPLKDAYERLRADEIAYIGDGIHDCLPDGPGFGGLRALLTIQQGTPWLLVLHPDLHAPRGDLHALRGLRIAAARGPDFALRGTLREAGIDSEVDVCALPGAEEAGVSYGVTAAHALEQRLVDGFWANAMGAAVAVHRGVGVIHLDVRRGDGPDSAKDFSFGALITTAARTESEPEQVRAVMRAVIDAQRILREAPERAAEVGKAHFPEEEAGLIEGLVTRDRSFYDPRISPESIRSMIRFSRDVGLLASDASYEELVATQYSGLWSQAD